MRRFSPKTTPEILPARWRFFLRETALDQACQPRAIPSWHKSEPHRPRHLQEPKGVPDEKRRATQVPALSALPCLGSPKDGRPSPQLLPASVALRGREKSPQGGTAFLPLYAKNPPSTDSQTPISPSDKPGRPCRVDFSRPARHFGHPFARSGYKFKEYSFPLIAN